MGRDMGAYRVLSKLNKFIYIKFCLPFAMQVFSTTVVSIMFMF